MTNDANMWHFYGSAVSAAGKPARGCRRTLTDSAIKRNRKEVLANYD
jgi:hypothetical protein